jgi:hypothetical protein
MQFVFYHPTCGNIITLVMKTLIKSAQMVLQHMLLTHMQYLLVNLFNILVLSFQIEAYLCCNVTKLIPLHMKEGDEKEGVE